MFELSEEEFNYCEEMEKRNQEADRLEQFKQGELCRMYNCEPSELEYLQECDKAD